VVQGLAKSTVRFQHGLNIASAQHRVQEGLSGGLGQSQSTLRMVGQAVQL
jgi:hypothetical protein